MKLRTSVLFPLVAALALTACGDSDATLPDTSSDVGDVGDVGNATEPDTDEPDADEPDGTDDATPPDAGPGDDAAEDAAEDAAPDAVEDASEDASEDAAEDAAPDAVEDASEDASEDAAEDAGGDTADAGPELPITAAVGERCAWSERVGLIEISRWGGSGPVDLTGWIESGPSPWYGEPALSSDVCDFHSYSPSSCGPCPGGETCAIATGACAKVPARLTDVALVVQTPGGEEQATEANAVTGDLWLPIELEGETFSLTLTVGGHEVVVPALTVPGDLDDLAGALGGYYDAPKSLDVTWTAPAKSDDAFVTTHIPINHHAAGPTFTDCATPVTAGALHVDAEMLEPLAVITGLEFQGIDHARFAAAHTPAGCVEFRFSSRLWVDLQ